MTKYYALNCLCYMDNIPKIWNIYYYNNFTTAGRLKEMGNSHKIT